MEIPVEQISIEQRIENLGCVFADCIKEEFEDILQGATIAVYIEKPKFHERGADSGILFDISHDSVDIEKLRFHCESLTQRFLDKASSTYRESKRYPDINHRIRFLGQILKLGQMEISESESTELSNLDRSDFCKIVETTLNKKKYKVVISRDQIVELVKLVGPETLEQLTEQAIEFLKNLN